MKEERKKKRYHKGHFIGIGIAIGLPLGIPFGIAIDSIALGPAMGLPLGLAIGLAMESRLNKNPIEPTDEEKARQRRLSWIGVAIGVLLLISVIVLFIAKLD